MSTDLARRDRRDELPSETTAGAITQALEGLKAIRTFVKQQFTPGVDAGIIKGCGDKPTLLLPGAQKATMYFNAYPTYRVKEKDLGGGHVTFRVRCLLISRATREQIGEGIGCASTKEKKWKRGGTAKECPSCGTPNVKKGSEKFGGGWYCDRKAGGCGAKFSDSHKGLAQAKESEVADDSAYEMQNTVLKMAKKRAHVDAAMTLGCLSELFTQDIEDTFRMVEVREAARPEEPEPYHVNGEVIEAPAEDRPARHAPGKNNLHPNNSGFHNGQYASPQQIEAYTGRLRNKVDDINAAWLDFWQDRRTGEIPAPIKRELMSVFQADGHLVKWLVETGQIDPDALEKNGQARLLGSYAAIAMHRSKPEAQALAAELDRYFVQCFEDKKGAIYRKHPELAPDGFQDEQEEAARNAAEERGDAWEPTDKDYAEVAEAGGNA